MAKIFEAWYNKEIKFIAGQKPSFLRRVLRRVRRATRRVGKTRFLWNR